MSKFLAKQKHDSNSDSKVIIYRWWDITRFINFYKNFSGGQYLALYTVYDILVPTVEIN